MQEEQTGGNPTDDGVRLGKLRAFTQEELADQMSMQPEKWAGLLMSLLGDTEEVMVSLLGLDSAPDEFVDRAIEFLGFDPRDASSGRLRSAGIEAQVLDRPMSGLEFRTAVVLSTSHLEEQVVSDAANPTRSKKREWIYRTEYGFIGYCYDDPPFLAPRSIKDCCNYIRSRIGISPARGLYLLFDMDGPVMDGLPVYEW